MDPVVLDWIIWFAEGAGWLGMIGSLGLIVLERTHKK